MVSRSGAHLQQGVNLLESAFHPLQGQQGGSDGVGIAAAGSAASSLPLPFSAADLVEQRRMAPEGIFSIQFRAADSSSGALLGPRCALTNLAFAHHWASNISKASYWTPFARPHRVTPELSHELESVPRRELKSKMVKAEHELSQQHQQRSCKVKPVTEPEASVCSPCREKELRAFQAREQREQSRATRRATRRSLFLGQLVLACSFPSVVSTDCSRCAREFLRQRLVRLEAPVAFDFELLFA